MEAVNFRYKCEPGPLYIEHICYCQELGCNTAAIEDITKDSIPFRLFIVV